MIIGTQVSENYSPQLKRLQKTAESCMLKDDLLYHISMDSCDKPKWQIYPHPN